MSRRTVTQYLPSPSISTIIAGNELRRYLRQARDNDLFAVIAGLVALFIVIALPVLYSIATDLGELFAAGETAGLELIIATVCGLWVFIVMFEAAEALGRGGVPEFKELELTIRPHRDVVGGLIGHETVWVSSLVFIPSVVLFAGLAVGLGTMMPFVGGIIGTAAILFSAIPVGFALGFTLRAIVRRSPLLLRLRPLVGTAFGIGVLLLIFSGRFVPVMMDVGSWLVDSPLGWFGDLLFLTTPEATPSTGRAIAALIGAVTIGVAGLAASIRAAEAAWYTDRVQRESPTRSHHPADWIPPRFAQLDVFLQQIRIHQTTSSIVTIALLRAYRAPLQLLYVLTPVVLLLPVFDNLVRHGALPSYSVWLVMLSVAWAAGAAFPLNIIGSQTAVLSLLLSVRVRASHWLHAMVLAGILPLIIPGIVVTSLVAWGVGYSVVEVALIGIASMGLVAGGTVVASAIGIRFSRQRQVLGSTKQAGLPPSLLAFILYSTVIGLATLSITVIADETLRWTLSVFLSTHLPFSLSISADALRWIAIGLLAIIGMLLPLSYWYARKTLGEYQLS